MPTLLGNNADLGKGNLVIHNIVIGSGNEEVIK